MGVTSVQGVTIKLFEPAFDVLVKEAQVVDSQNHACN